MNLTDYFQILWRLLYDISMIIIPLSIQKLFSYTSLSTDEI